jgi:hypothetical protein
MVRKLVLPIVALAFVVWVAGCSKSPTTTNATSNNSQLAQQFGGYDATPSTPNFGDPTLATATQGETPVSDPVANSVVADSLQKDTTSGIFHLRAVWGRLHYDSTVTIPTNWDGSLRIEPRGVIVLKKKIRFEPATDSILHRDSVNVLRWASTTTVASDGIDVVLLIPRPKSTYDTTIVVHVDSLGDTTRTVTVDTIPGPPSTVSFVTGPYSRTFTLTELAKLDTIVSLTDSNAISFNAYEVRHNACPRGFVTGYWGADSSGTKIFRGLWISNNGLNDGSLEGYVTTDTFGVNVFYGKWVDQSGAFQGLLRGIWGLYPGEKVGLPSKGRGWFFGGIYDANATLVGSLKGNFRGANSNNPGFFEGRWKIGCPGDGGMDDGMNGNDFERPFEHNGNGNQGNGK